MMGWSSEPVIRLNTLCQFLYYVINIEIGSSIDIKERKDFMIDSFLCDILKQLDDCRC